MTDTRFRGHQLPGLCEAYKTVWIIIEGFDYQPDNQGKLRIFGMPPKYWPYWQDVEQYKLTLEQRAGIFIQQTNDRYVTARWLAALYRWWTEKAADAHRSHLALHTQRAPAGSIRPPSFLRKVAKELPGVGWDRSLAIAQAFPSVRDMVNADEAQWTQIPGIGKKLASNIVKAVNGQ